MTAAGFGDGARTSATVAEGVGPLVTLAEGVGTLVAVVEGEGLGVTKSADFSCPPSLLASSETTRYMPKPVATNAPPIITEYRTEDLMRLADCTLVEYVTGKGGATYISSVVRSIR